MKSKSNVPALSVAASVMAIMAAILGRPRRRSDYASGCEQDSNQLEEVVVTAQFREQNLQDTPIAITAVNARDDRSCAARPTSPRSPHRRRT